MSTHKNFDKICAVVLVLLLVLTGVLMAFGQSSDSSGGTTMGYEDKLFDTSSVHKINIVMDDWDNFISNATSEEYYTCTLEIDGETYKNVAIRGKGNTSLTKVASYGNDRYSFKVEFDRYDSSVTYHGLDKLCLNNIIQDNTYMKDYLCYRLMAEMGVASPLCSYVYVSVNGSDWGLYLAVEGIEESFLQRNYGSDYGELYKPDSQSMGGGRGNGKGFDMDDFDPAENAGDKGGGQPGDKGGGKDGMNSSDDTLLKYIDDDPDSYSNIFDNAKTDVSKSDKKRLIAALKTLSGDEPESAVDVDAVIRYFVVHNFVLNFDSYTGSMIHNYYLYESDGQMQMIPWDYNLAFGAFQSAGGATNLVNYPIDDPVSGGSIEDRPMLAWIFQSEEYTELYHKYFAELISTVFDSGEFAQEFDSVVQMISPYVESDPTKFCTYEEFETGVETLREFCLLRAESISGQLDGSIGSTSDTQKNSTLIDASSLQISDMGTMGNDQGGGNGGDFGGGNAPQMPDNAGDNSPPDKPNGNTGTPPAKPDGDTNNSSGSNSNTPPAKPNDDAASTSSTGNGKNAADSSGDGSSTSSDSSANANNGASASSGGAGNEAGNTSGSASNGTGDSSSDTNSGAGANSNTPPSKPDGNGGSNSGGPNANGGNGENGGAPNGAPTGSETAAVSTSTLILSAASISVLIIGLAVAILYKRRK